MSWSSAIESAVRERAGETARLQEEKRLAILQLEEDKIQGWVTKLSSYLDEHKEELLTTIRQGTGDLVIDHPHHPTFKLRDRWAHYLPSNEWDSLAEELSVRLSQVFGISIRVMSQSKQYREEDRMSMSDATVDYFALHIKT